MDQPFTSAPHHDLLVLLVQVAVLLLTARLLGELAQRLNQPTVVGEILAGILLGPSLLSSLVPAIGAWLIPHTPTQGYLLEVISLLGAMFLLLITGLETDLALIRRHARTAIGVSLGGISVTFATGFILGQFLPDTLLARPDARLVFSLFIATSMSISAIPVIAKVLIDLNLMRRDVGQTIIASGMTDDTIGWILLSIVAGIAGGEAVTIGSVLQSVGSVLAFMVLSFTVGQWLVRWLLKNTQDRLRVRDRVLSLVIVLMFAWGAITQALHIEAVLGAFVIGILFSQMRGLHQDIIHTLEAVALGIFSPIFFAVAGLKVNLVNLLQLDLLIIAFLVIAVATLGKVVGTYLGARVIGRRDHWTALSFGAGLNARGAMEIIIATVGLSLGILTQDMFSIIVLMAMTTSLMAPTALRWVLKRVKPSEEELARLRQEELNQNSLVPNIHRVLLPVRPRPTSGSAQRIEARLLERLSAKSGLDVTLMTVTPTNGRSEINRYLDEVAGLFSKQPITKRIVTGTQPADLILDEVSNNYDLLVLGAPERQSTSEILFNPVVDFLMRTAPCPTLLVQGEHSDPNWTPRRILVPSNGSLAARRAAEIAFALVTTPTDEVIVLQVVETSPNGQSLDATGALTDRQVRSAELSLSQLQTLGESQGVFTATRVQIGAQPDETILTCARDLHVDLIVLGTNVSVGSDRLYLGPRVERILHNAPCPVVVLNTIN